MTSLETLTDEKCTITYALLQGNRPLPKEINDALSKKDFDTIRKAEKNMSNQYIVSTAIDSVIDLMLVDGLTVHEAQEQVVRTY